MLTWDNPDERFFHHGLDRGVLYVPGIDPVPWNGLVGFDEGGEAENGVMYRDGVIYYSDAEPSDFQGKLTCIFFPEEFRSRIGMPEATEGLYVDNQKPKPFSMAYRTLVGSGTAGDRFGYQIHLVYNCTATIAPRARKTLSDQVEITEFSFDIVCTPVKLAGFRPSAHYIIDTRGMGKPQIAELEALLYGVQAGNGEDVLDDTLGDTLTGFTPGRMPTPTELFDMMNFGEAIIFEVHSNGTYTVKASSTNLVADGQDRFIVNNVNATAPVAGEFTVSDGGTTTVTID